MPDLILLQSLLDSFVILRLLFFPDLLVPERNVKVKINVTMSGQVEPTQSYTFGLEKVVDN